MTSTPTAASDGWTVELVIEDTNYNVEQHIESVREDQGRGGCDRAVDGFADERRQPRRHDRRRHARSFRSSWYSGWAIPEFDNGLAFEQNTNYCIEAMNLIDFIRRAGWHERSRWSTFPGDYGQDAAAGVQLAADFYGIEIVYDGEGVVIPGQDQTPVITEIVDSGADWVFVTTNASTLPRSSAARSRVAITGHVDRIAAHLRLPPARHPGRARFSTRCATSRPTRSPGAPTCRERLEMREVLTAAYPDRRPSDAFVIGWIESLGIQEALRDRHRQR